MRCTTIGHSIRFESTLTSSEAERQRTHAPKAKMRRKEEKKTVCLTRYVKFHMRSACIMFFMYEFIY